VSTRPPATRLDLVAENAELRARLAEAEDMLRANRRGEIDALVTHSDTGPRDISERKQMEDELRRSEQLHRIAFDLAPAGIVYVALDARFINVNARMSEITGYTADELLRMKAGDLTHLDDLAHDKQLIDAFLCRATPNYENEKRYVRKDGSSHWVAVSGRFVTDDAGQPVHSVCTVRDIQDRKTAEASLRRSEIRYRRLFEAAQDGVLILDPATRKIVDANPFMTKLLGYPHDQLIGMELYQIGFLADAQSSRDMFQTLTATRQVRYENLPLQNRAGGLREVEVVANLYDEAGHSVVQCNVRDITERKQDEAAHREREAELSRAHRIAGLGSFKVEVRDGNFVADRSPEYLAVHGLTSQDRGSSHEAWLHRLHPEDREKADRTLREFLADGRKLYQSEYRIIRQNDSATRWIRVLAEIERDASGAPLRLFGTHLDVTESRLHEAALRTSETRYRRLFEAAHDGVLILDPVTRKIIAANPFMTTLLGYPRDRLIGMELYQIGFLADAQASRDMFQTLTATRQVRYENLPLQNRAGGLREVEVVANLYDEAGHSVVQCNVRDITERRRAEEAVTRLAAIVESTADAVIGLDVENRIISWNGAAEALFGYTAEEVIGRGGELLVPPGEPLPGQNRRGAFDAALAGEQFQRDTVRVAKDGTVIDVNLTATQVRTPDGQVLGVAAIMRDISERKRAETELRERQHFLNRIFEVLPGVLYVFDLDENRVVFVNYQAEGTYSSEEIAGMGADVVPNLMHPDDQPRFQEHIARIRTLGAGATATFEYRMRDKADEWRWYLSTDTVFLRDESGAVRQFIGVAPEITDRKLVGFALQASEHRYRTLIDATSAVTWSCAPSGLLVEPQPQWTAFTGQSTSELLGGGHATAFHPDDAENAWARWADAVARDAPYHNELRIRRYDGEWRWMRVHCVPVHSEGVAVEWFGMCIDITERKQAQAARQESEALQAFLLELSDALRAEPSAAAMTDRALRMLFGQLRLDRCYVGIYRVAEDIGEFPHQVHDDRLPPFPAQVRLSDFPKALQVAFDRTLVIDDVGKMEDLSDIERANFAGLGVGALIAATLHKGENNPLWAIVAVSTSPRVWTPGEVSFVEEVAERTWAAVERARAEAALHAAHDTFRHLVDRSPFGVYVIDADFRLAQISDGGQKAFGNVRPLIGRDFTEVVRAVWPDPFASEVIARFRHTLATGEPFKAETNERRADIEATEAYDWKIERVNLPDGQFGVVCHFYDLSERKRHEEHIKLLMSEVNHRSKNMLGLVQAIAKRTIATRPEDFIERFGQRVQALAANQDLLVRSEWRAVSLGELVRSQLAHFGDARDTRVALDGPPVEITASASQAIGMALHELATNAAKYGALSNKLGHVALRWSVRSDAAGTARFIISWVESGGPTVAKPTRPGFGSTVIGTMIKMSLGCDAEIDFAPTGLVWRIDCPAAGVIVSNASSAAPSNLTAVKEKLVQAPGRRRVLVVEDEPLIAMEIVAILSDAGFTVVGPAGSVAQALAVIERSGCEAAVLDINLGKETAEPIARVLSARATPFVTISGYSREQQPAAFRNAPLVSKPVRPERLVAEIRKCFGEAF
jgi:PAS domain S-box-containing protein